MSLKDKDDRITGKQADIRYGGTDKRDSRNDWRTPAKLLKQIYNMWDLSFDPCPYIRPDGWDGLEDKWGERCFVNPPYGKDTEKWLRKAIKEISEGNTKIAVFLIHARTDTKWFHDLVLGGAQELLFIKGRVSFVDPAENSAPSAFPSLLAVYYTPPLRNEIIVESWSQKGE